MTFDGNESGNESNETKTASPKKARKSVSTRGTGKVRKVSAKTRAYEQTPIELLPNGISVTTSIGRPVLILKDRTGVEVLPVWMQPLDASGCDGGAFRIARRATPHAVTRRFLAMMDTRVESCTFVDLVGHHQFVDLDFVTGDESKAKKSEKKSEKKSVKTLRVRADEAMSFCLQARAKFYCSRALMARCRDLDQDLTTLEHNLNDGLLPALHSEMEPSSKKQPYVM